MESQNVPEIWFRPVTVERLTDLADFSQCHGKFRYCSCMRWRMTSSAYRRSSKQDRVDALEELVRACTPVGILAYSEEQPVAWCSIAPRETYQALERYRALPRIDDSPVWSIVCLFVDRHFRRQGLTGSLLRAAVDYARDQNALIVEGYPVAPDATSYTSNGHAGIHFARPAYGRDAGGSKTAW